MAPPADSQADGADGNDAPEEGSEDAMVTRPEAKTSSTILNPDSKEMRSLRRRRSVGFALHGIADCGLRDDIDALAFEDDMACDSQTPLSHGERPGQPAAIMLAKASVEAAQRELLKSIGSIREHLNLAGDHLAKASGTSECNSIIAQAGDTLDSLPSIKSNVSPSATASLMAPVTAPEQAAPEQAVQEAGDHFDRKSLKPITLDSLPILRCDMEQAVKTPPVGAFPSVEQLVFRADTYDDHSPDKAPLTTMSSGSCPHAVNAETLLDTWPSSLEIRWTVSPRKGDSSSSLTQRPRKQYSRRRASMSSVEEWQSEQDVDPRRWQEEHGCKHRLVIHPSSTYRMAHDVLSASLLAYDVVVIPWTVAWDASVEGALFYMAWVTTIFWTFDILVSFITGYNARNWVVMEPRAIMRNYLGSWFFPDTAIVMCDWLSLVFATSKGLRTLRLAKIGRLLRLLALFRMIKLARALSEFIDEKLSDFAQVTVRVAKMICITLTFAHIISCVWFLIGRSMPSDTGMRWTDSRDLLEENLWYQYTTSLHWAMSQLTLGAVEVVSSTIAERVFSIVCLLVGLLFGSTFVSSLSATMLEVQMDQRETHQKMQLLRRYLRENKVDRSLAAQAERQLGERLVGRDKIKEEQVKGLELLSTSLRSELRYHLCAPYLKSHSLFQVWILIDAKFVMHFCRKCMDFVHLRTQDDLFTAGKMAECAYFFISGSIRYTQDPQSSPMSTTRIEDVEERKWLAEAALWSHWIHVGTAHATQYSEVAGIHVANMNEVMQQTTTIMQLTGDYCRKFHRCLQAARPPALGWPDDLKVPLTDWSEMVPAMDVESQVIIGLESIRHAYTSRRMWLKGFTGLDKLAEEVKTGKSSVMLNGQELERVASIVALKICNEAGQFLVQIGKEVSGSMRPACQLPGGKQGSDELPADTMERVLAEKMSQIGDHVEVITLERHVEIKESQEFGVRTKYLRHVVISKLECLAGLEQSILPEVTWERMEPVASAQRLSDGQTSWSVQEFSRLTMGRATSDGANQMGLPFQEAARAFCQRPVFCMEDSKGGRGLYAWLNEEEYAKLKSPTSEKLLSVWLATQCDVLEEHQRRGSLDEPPPPVGPVRTDSEDPGGNAGPPRSPPVVVQGKVLDFTA